MRSEYIKQIFMAFAQGNKDKFLEIAHEVINEEEKKSHHYLAKELKDIVIEISNGRKLDNNLLNKRYKNAIPIPRDQEKGFPLLEIREFSLDWNDIVLDEETKNALITIIDEIKQTEVLASYGLKPKQKILFCGPPGTGKTLSSQIISSALCYPLVQIRFESIVSSFLGETASNLKKVFDFIEQGQWVVLFDEFDVVGKHRDDPNEHGEIKRVVNNFMQMLDNYTGESILIAATNHQYLIDSALWRRFDDILFFGLPNDNQRNSLFKKYLRVLNKEKNLNFNIFIKETEGFSAADISQICWDALKRVILNNSDTIKSDDLLWAINQQIRRKKIEGGVKDKG